MDDTSSHSVDDDANEDCDDDDDSIELENKEFAHMDVGVSALADEEGSNDKVNDEELDSHLQCGTDTETEDSFEVQPAELLPLLQQNDPQCPQKDVHCLKTKKHVRNVKCKIELRTMKGSVSCLLSCLSVVPNQLWISFGGDNGQWLTHTVSLS